MNAAPPGAALRARALRLLARREFARAELRGRLQAWAEPGDDVDGLLDSLQSAGWLSDERAAQSAARRRAGRSGALALAHDLRRRGIAGEAAEAVLGPARDSEPLDARALLRRRFPEPPADAAERARRWRFLQARGFAPESIRAALAGLAAEDDH